MSDRPYITPAVQSAASTALALEIIFGFFGLLGIGHIYGGRIVLGILLMVGWWIAIGASWLFMLGTLGLGACLAVPAFFAGFIISGIKAKGYVLETGDTGDWTRVALAVVGGLAVIVMSFVLLAVFSAAASQ
jgi:hypothetical protein